VHVPYKGGGQAMTDALGGQIPLVFTAVAGAQQHVKNGKLSAIAVSSATVEQLAKLGIAPTPGTPDAFAAQLRTDLAKYGKVVATAGISGVPRSLGLDQSAHDSVASLRLRSRGRGQRGLQPSQRTAARFARLALTSSEQASLACRPRPVA
jgi:hypothetical protein